MGNAVSSLASATIGVDSVEEGFFADRVDQIELRVVNANAHALHLDAIAMSYGVVARHDRLDIYCTKGSLVSNTG